MAESRHPKDPREVWKGRHRERGEARFSFTYSDIARAAGVSKKTVQNAASRGEVDPDDLESVIAFVVNRRGRKARRAG